VKVLVVSSKYPPEYAGSGLRAHNTYKRLREKYGIEFEVVCNSVEYHDTTTYRYEGVDVHRISEPVFYRLLHDCYPEPAYRIGKGLKYYVEAYLTRRQLEAKDFDVVHVFGDSASTATAILWAQYHNKPLVLELVNTPKESPDQYLPGLNHVPEYDLRERCVIVSISSQLKQMCADYGLSKNVWTRPNPVDDARFNPNVFDSRNPVELTNFNDTDNIILYVAAFKPRKNHIFLLDVLDKLPEEYKLVLAGPADEAGRHELRDKQVIAEIRDPIDQLQLSNRVDLRIGFVDMAEFLSVSDVFCFPSWNEAMGTPLLESIASGVPVVANADENSFQEWIVNGENGFLCPLEPDDWATSIVDSVAMSPEKRRKAGDRILEEVSAEAIDRQYRSILRSITSSAEGEIMDIDEILR